SAAGAAEPPVHDIEVSGTGVGMYPAFSSDVERYGVTTTAGTQGSVTVAASTSDPDGTVLIDGVPTPGGTSTIDGLDVGDEVSVMFKDSAGTAVHALIYLPQQFPAMTESVPATAASSTSDLTLNLSRYALGTPNFEVALDRHGVPRHVRSFPTSNQSADFKPGGPAGHYIVARSPTPTAGRQGSQLVELDAGFEETGRTFETVGLVNTDQHDAILRPDGSRILIAYEPNEDTGLTDSVIQEVDAQGQVVYTWSTADHLTPSEETVTPTIPDYGHINSIELTQSGDILASFRHFSSAMKIAWHAEGTVERGDILWRLGGRKSDFAFVDDPLGGPCAQHTATELANGHILLFDNGSDESSGLGPFCVDPEDPEGDTHNRAQTRVTEYALDEAADTATLVWHYQIDGRHTRFAGSSRRLANGNTLIGWAADPRAVATEVDEEGDVVWELKNGEAYFAYRVASAEVEDVVDPEVTVASPVDGASYAYGEKVTPEFGCTDRGGSSLHSCTGPAVDTTVAGQHTYQVTATDGDGNATTVSRSYTVAPAPFSRPDLAIHTAASGWVGNNIYGAATNQTVTQQLARRGAQATASVRVQSEGNRTDDVTVKGPGSSKKFAVRYYRGDTDVTSAVIGGRLRVTLLAGQYVYVRVVTTRLAAARTGDVFQVSLVGTSRLNTARRDAVAQRVRAIG
ncbi:MAG: aryl-sulfate sulfotransferase, partial [Marmoricola sp.]